MKKPLNLSLDIGADPVAVPAPTSEAAAPKKGPGRPAKPPRDNPRRIAVTVDDDTYGRVLHACADLRIDRQTFLERAIALMFADLQKPK